LVSTTDVKPRPDSGVARFLLNTKYVRFLGKRVVRTYTSTTTEGMRFMFHTRDGGERYLMTQVADTHVYERFAIGQGSTVVDAGANIGMFTVIASRLVGEHGVVAAVEPNPPSFHLMKKNLSLNGCENVKAIMAALGEKESTGRLNLYSQSVLNSFFAWNRTDRVVRDSVTVQIKTLDGLMHELGLKRLDLLKIDTEGYELPILKGGMETIRKFKPYIVGEAHPTLSDSGSKITEFLSGMGYRCQVEPMVDDAEMFYADPGKRD
jgi:FkbM family methyltransferase